MESAFGADVDFTQFIKLYGPTPESAKGRYSPADCTGIIKTLVTLGRAQAVSLPFPAALLLVGLHDPDADRLRRRFELPGDVPGWMSGPD